MWRGPLSAPVGQDTIQAFLHQSGQPTSSVGWSGSYSASTTSGMGETQELWRATVFEYKRQFLPNVPKPARAAAMRWGRSEGALELMPWSASKKSEKP